MASLDTLIGMVRYAITAEDVTAAELARLASRADFILLRTPKWDAGPVIDLLRRLPAPVVTNQILVHRRVDVAMACGAAGVHLSSRAGELTATQVRKLMPAAIVSISTHSLTQVEQARDANFILFAPIFEKRVAGEVVVPGVGLHQLRQACQLAPNQVLALGGVTPENTPACLEAGAAGVAGIRLFR